MDRRDALKSAAAFAVATGVAAVTGTDALEARTVAATSSRRGPYVDTRDGQSLFYKDWGSGTPIVFLGAWGLPSDMWQYQMTPLSEQGFRCVTYDRRGHGRSSHAGSVYDYDTLADDLAAVRCGPGFRAATSVSSRRGGHSRAVTRGA